MTTEPSPRQVLYALVSAGFLVVVVVLIIGAGMAELVPVWWTVAMSVLAAGAAIWGIRSWRRTGPVLSASIGLFVLWTVGTLLVS